MSGHHNGYGETAVLNQHEDGFTEPLSTNGLAERRTVEADGREDSTVYHKSSHSTNDGSCVEVAQLPRGVAVRDTWRKLMLFSSGEWDSLTGGIRDDPEAFIAGKVVIAHELGNGTTFAQVPNTDGGVDWCRSDLPGIILQYSAGESVPGDTPSEIGAFVLGVVEREPQLTAIPHSGGGGN